jgi:hypothetical protein
MVKVPLRVLVTDPKLAEQPEMAERIEMLRKQGHTIEVGNGQLMQYDFICGPNCWLANSATMNLFVLAVNNARRIANADQERTEQEATKRSAARASRKGTKATGRKRRPAKKAQAVRGPVTAGEASNDVADHGVI